ncbi:MAG: hypothetical protein KDD66_18000 [Bdellovibrionales bacterium]|nr:hypothetical protein [Bdellovibrionales bacterium]
MSVLSRGYAKFNALCSQVYVLRETVSTKSEKYSQPILFVVGAGLLGLGLSNITEAQSLVLNDDRIQCAAHQLLALTEGNMGALLMVVAGLATIISAAFGAFRAATSLLVVACSAFILRSLVHIFFNLGPLPPGCATIYNP